MRNDELNNDKHESCLVVAKDIRGLEKSLTPLLLCKTTYFAQK